MPANARLTITLKAGSETDYLFDNSDSTALTVHSRGGAQLRIPKGDVAEVVQHKPRSNKPTLIGAAVGGAAGAGIGAAAFCVSGSCDLDERAVGLMVGLGLIGAGAGALTGYFVTAVPPDEVLYQAP